MTKTRQTTDHPPEEVEKAEEEGEAIEAEEPSAETFRLPKRRVNTPPILRGNRSPSSKKNANKWASGRPNTELISMSELADEPKAEKSLS